jgi:hypothetical protein
MERPPPSLSDGWTRKTGPPEIDPTFLDSLSPELKAEILGQHKPMLSSTKRKSGDPDARSLKKIKSGPGLSVTQAIEIEDDPEVIGIESSPDRRIGDSRRTLNPAEFVAKTGASPVTNLKRPTYEDLFREGKPHLDEADTTDDFDDQDTIFDDPEADTSQQLICAKCGTTVFAFAKGAHDRWHEGEDDDYAIV